MYKSNQLFSLPNNLFGSKLQSLFTGFLKKKKKKTLVESYCEDISCSYKFG
jgi:hypothetical protein